MKNGSKSQNKKQAGAIVHFFVTNAPELLNLSIGRG